MATTTDRYHHGNLRAALITGGVELAREGGPEAIVLREAARRIGVSPTAAYRHFSSLPELVGAVARVGMDHMTDVMEAELASVPDHHDGTSRAIERVKAVGRGYIRFALTEPGLFSTAFRTGPRSVDEVASPDDQRSDRSPATVMLAVLGDLVEADLLDPADVGDAFIFAWSSVHGLSALLLDKRSATPSERREGMIDTVIDRTLRGLIGDR